MGFRGAIVRATSAEAIPSGGFQPLSFDEAIQDDAGYWDSGSPTRFTVPAGADGLYFGAVCAQLELFSGYNAANNRLNGTQLLGGYTQNAGIDRKAMIAAWVRQLAAGDYVEPVVRQTSGANKNTISTNWKLPHAVIVQLDAPGVTAFSGARVSHSVSQTHAGRTAMDHDTTDYDDEGFHDAVGNPSRLTAQATDWHIFGAYNRIEDLGGTFRRDALRLNGADYLAEGAMYGTATIADDPAPVPAWAYPMSAGDYIESVVDGNGGNDVFTSEAWIVRGI